MKPTNAAAITARHCNARLCSDPRRRVAEAESRLVDGLDSEEADAQGHHRTLGRIFHCVRRRKKRGNVRLGGWVGTVEEANRRM